MAGADPGADRPVLLATKARDDLTALDPALARLAIEHLRRLAAGTGDPASLTPVPGESRWYAYPFGPLTAYLRFVEPDADRPNGAILVARLTDRSELEVLAPKQARLTLRVSAAAAAGAFALGVLTAPGNLADNGRYAAFSGLFATTAQVIATLLVALAIEARTVIRKIRFALPTVAYVGAGLTAAVAGTSASLPKAAYPWIIGVMLAGGAGALVTTLLLSYWGITSRLPSAERPTPDDASEVGAA